jgi:hypothetical protein
MGKYAFIINNKVVNTIKCSADRIINYLNTYDHVVLITGLSVGIGDFYEPSTGLFTTNTEIPAEVLMHNAYCTILQFRSKFTDNEKVAIYTAAKNNLLIQIWLEDMNCVQNNMIHLEDPRTVGGVQALEAMGIIGVGRAAQILSH